MVTNMESSNNYNNELDLALDDAISGFHAEEENLQDQIKSNETFRNTYKKLNFHYDTSVFPAGWKNIILKMKKYDVDKNSLEGALLKNEQIQHLFATIISSHIQSRNARLERLKGKEKENDEMNWEKYSNIESTPEKFEEFLLSDEWMQILINEINRHLDENGNVYSNYKITSDILALKLRTAWFDKMYREYSLQYLVDGVDEKENMLRQSVNIILDNVDDKIGDYLKKWWDKSWRWLLKSINSMFNGEDNWFSLEELQGSDFNKDELRWLLKNKIQRYAGRILKLRKRENIWQYLWNTELDLQLKSYLYIYGKSFYPEDFNKPWWELADYEWTLLEIFEAILHYDGKLETVKNNKFVEKEKKAENARKQREKQRVTEIAQRNKERNERLQSIPKFDKNTKIDGLQSKSLNPNSASWVEIAADANLWKDLNDYELDIEESEHKQERRKETAFREAWKDFIQSRDDIKSLITQEQMRRLFDINSNTIIISEWERFKKSNPLLKDMPSDKVEEIRTKLSGFSSYFNDAEKKLSEDSSEMKVKLNETVKTYAIWAVIDNVRDTFDVITEWQSWDFKWFQLDKENPVKKEWNNIIISGLFNGAEVKVRYDLRTGELFMNSFLHRLSTDKISIWKTSSLDYPIGTIKPFNDVLNDYYKLPPRSQKGGDIQWWSHDWEKRWMRSMNHPWHNSNDMEHWNNSTPQEIRPHGPMSRPAWPQIPNMNENNVSSRRQEAEKVLNSQIDLIGQAIKDNTESQAQKNSAITGFLKTFNVTSAESSFTSWEFNRWSNLFDMIEIIENTWDLKDGDIQSLEYFNNEFMPTVMEYSWLKWWERNIYQDKNNKKSEKIFNYDGDNENIKYFRGKIDNFNPEQFSWIANFDSSYQLWFADFIKENFITWNGANWILNISEMRDFIRDLETIDNEADIKLEEELANVN